MAACPPSEGNGRRVPDRARAAPRDGPTRASAAARPERGNGRLGAVAHSGPWTLETTPPASRASAADDDKPDPSGTLEPVRAFGARIEARCPAGGGQDPTPRDGFAED